MGTRDRIVHGYDSIDFDRLWTVLTADLPQLVLDIGMLLETRFGQAP